MKKPIPTQREITFTRSQAAEYLNLSVPTLARYASKGKGPHYFIIGNQARYRRVHLDDYIESCRVTPTRR